MKSAIAICLLLFAVFALAVDPPVIDDNFSAQVELFEERGKHTQRYRGFVFEDYTRSRQRINTNHTHEHPVDVTFFRFYKTHDDYVVQGEKCTHRQLNGTMHPAFAWVKHGATLAKHECHAKFRHGASGQLWTKTDDKITASLCVNRQDPSDPFWVSYTFTDKKEGRLIHFERFIPGQPASANFILPKNCQTSC